VWLVFVQLVNDSLTTAECGTITSFCSAVSTVIERIR